MADLLLAQVLTQPLQANVECDRRRTTATSDSHGRLVLKQVIEERFGVIYNERTISKLLVALGFSHISARPQHPRQDERVMRAFKKTSPA